MRSASISRLQLLLTAFLFSTGGAAIKATVLTGWQVASFRSLVAAVSIMLLMPEVRRSWNWRVPLAGLAYSGTLVLYVLANKLTTAANAIFLQDTAPLYLLLLGPWLLNERIRRSDLLLMTVMAVGMALFFVGNQAALPTAPDPLRGNVVAVLSGVGWAFTIAGLRWIESRNIAPEAGMATVVAGNLIAGLICLPKALPVVRAGWSDWLIVVSLGVFQIALSYFFMTKAMRRTPALEASLIMLAEPAMNPIWTWFVHGERPSGLAILGGFLILAASLLRAVWRRE